MHIDITPPPDDLMACFGNLEAVLAADAAGEKVRRLATYFGQAEMETRQWQLRTTDFEKRRMAGCLADAFAASKRVVASAWSKKHGREFAA